MNPGTVVTVDFRGIAGVKRRPAVVVSSSVYHDERPDVILAVITSQVGKSNAKTDYLLSDWSSANLAKPSAVRIFLLTSPKTSVIEIGELSESDWGEVKKRLMLSIEF